MKKNLIHLLVIYFTFSFFYSCSENDAIVDIQHQTEGLEKGTKEYNLGILKIFKFEDGKGYINEKLAKELGFSSEQITKFREEVDKGNILIQEELNKGAKVESFNPKNLSPEEILNQKDI
ncbi:hypothetical protein [Empedobacter brevis]|uniref:hypothetical protein n=1 Tax=Empedobacter brevis TaxID=247 RepID=UPI0039AF4B59